MQVPFSGWGRKGHGWHAAVERAGRGVIAGDCGTLPAASFKGLYINCYRSPQLSMDYRRRLPSTMPAWCQHAFCACASGAC